MKVKVIHLLSPIWTRPPLSLDSVYYYTEQRERPSHDLLPIPGGHDLALFMTDLVYTVYATQQPENPTPNALDDK